MDERDLLGARGESDCKKPGQRATLGSHKGAVVFALVMFQKCSVFTSQFQTVDRQGRKHLLPVEEVHSQINKFRLHTETGRPTLHQNRGPEQREAAAPRSVKRRCLLWQSMNSTQPIHGWQTTTPKPTDRLMRSLYWSGKTSKPNNGSLLWCSSKTLPSHSDFKRKHRTALWLSTEARPSGAHASPPANTETLSPRSCGFKFSVQAPTTDQLRSKLSHFRIAKAALIAGLFAVKLQTIFEGTMSL